MSWLRRLLSRYRRWRLMQYECAVCTYLTLQWGFDCEDRLYGRYYPRGSSKGAPHGGCPKATLLWGTGRQAERVRQEHGI